MVGLPPKMFSPPHWDAFENGIALINSSQYHQTWQTIGVAMIHYHIQRLHDVAALIAISLEGIDLHYIQ